MSHVPFKPILLDLLQQARLAQDTFVQALLAEERDAVGSAARWSAKDHVAHLTFWRLKLVSRVRATSLHDSPAADDDFEQLNPLVFESHRHQQWAAVLAESDEAYAELAAVTKQLSEDDLTAFHRFDWTPDGWPLYSAYMGFCYEHAQQHLAQYALDRDDREKAIQTYEIWAGRVVETHAPDALRALVLYNLACFLATHAEMAAAAAALQRACALHPPLSKVARADRDLKGMDATVLDTLS